MEFKQLQTVFGFNLNWPLFWQIWETCILTCHPADYVIEPFFHFFNLLAQVGDGFFLSLVLFFHVF